MPRSVIITGGSSGIGKAAATALRRSDWAVTITARRPDELARAEASIGRHPALLAVSADMADPDGPASVVGAHVERFGGVDAIVYCAGVYDEIAVADLTAEIWDRSFDVMVRGAALTCAAAASWMKRAGRGRIVMVSSINAFQSERDTGAYSSAKAAVAALTRSVAVDLAPYGVTANCVSPGWITTPMTEKALSQATREQLLRVNPLGRAGTADEIASVVQYLVSDAPDFLTGSSITVDGGQTAFSASV